MTRSTRARDVRSRGGSTFSSLRVRNYRLYAVGQTVSVIGTWMQNIALGWATLELTHSGAVLGVVTGARYLPVLVLGPWGGLVVDRHDRRRLLVATQVCLAALSVLLAVLSGVGQLSLAVLVLIVVGLGFASVIENPARQSLISELVGEDHLANAIALNSTLINVAKLVGPTAAGVLIASVGVTPCFAANALSFLAVILSLLAMRRSELLDSEREVRAPGQIRAGIRYVATTPALLRPMLLVTVTGVLTWEFPVTVPLLTSSTFHAGPTGYGVATACMSVGAVLGGVVAARRRRLTVRGLAVSAVLWGAVIGAASLAPVLGVALGAFVVVGACSITFNSGAKTVLQLAAAPQMRGRVMSLWSIAWQGGTVLGAPLVGAVAAGLGPRFGLALGAVAAAGAGAVVLAMSRAEP